MKMRTWNSFKMLPLSILTAGLFLGILTACGKIQPETASDKNTSNLSESAANAGKTDSAAAQVKQERFVPPVDEGESDPSFSSFRTKLIEAAKKRDAKYVLSIIDPKIKNSFGGNNGIEEFKQDWKIDSPDCKFWKEFLAAMTNGGHMSDDKIGFSARIYSMGCPTTLTRLSIR